MRCAGDRAPGDAVAPILRDMDFGFAGALKVIRRSSGHYVHLLHW
jgi:6-phosphogluconate dehydrogenase (decarboxylating)